MDIINEFCNIEKDYVTLKNPMDKFSYNGIITCNKIMLDQIELLNRIVNKDANILINGETGTGKEVYAEYVHRISNRKNNKFVKLNCSTIPDQLFESEMFGYATGAFTGASRFGKKGLFELSDNGTIFLDEIGEMPIEMQSKLLRVIQEKKFMKVGSENESSVDVKIVSATNRNLRSMVEESKFREDLYYRLNVFPINLIPLRERKEDIILLTFYFLSECNNKYGYNKKLCFKVMSNFVSYNWPGNVRELRNTVERLVLLSTEEIIQETGPVIGGFKSDENFVKLDSVDKSINRENDLHESIDCSKSLKEIVEDYEIKIIKYYIDKNGSLRNAAKALKTSPATLSRKLSMHKCNTD